MSISLVSAEQLQAFGAVSLSEGLQYESGMFVQNTSGRVEALSIRGTRATHALVLIDGRRVSPGFQSAVDLSQFMSTGVERVEVLRGPVSALYGSDALGGVVNIITRRGETSRPTGDAYAQYGVGEWDSASAGVSAGWQVGAWGVAGAMSMRHTDEWESGDGAPSDVDDVTGWSGFSNVDYHLSPAAVIRASFHYDRTVREGLRPTSGGSRRRAEDERVGFDLAYEHLTADLRQGLVVRAYTDVYDGEVVFDLPAATAAKFNQTTESRITFGEARWRQPIRDDLSAVFGAEYSATAFDVTQIKRSDRSVDNRAVFAQAVWTPLQVVDVIAGLRYDQQGDYDAQVSPRISAGWRTRDGQWRLLMSYGGGFRAPNVTELVMETYANGGKTTVLPNAGLKPESSTSFEVGGYFSRGPWSARLVGFRNQLDDMIDQVTISTKGSLVTKQWVNLSRVDIDGLETGLSLTPSAYWQLEASCTWLDPIDRSTGYHVDGQYETLTRLMATVRHPSWGVRVQAALNWAGRQWGAQDAVAYGETRTVDARIVKSVGRGLDLYLGARNLLNAATDNHLPVHYYSGVRARF